MESLNRRELLAAASGLAGVSASGRPSSAAVGTSGEPPAQPRRLKVIVTGGHPGDPEYGCGGTIARYTDLGHEVVLLYLNRGEWPPSWTRRPARRGWPRPEGLRDPQGPPAVRRAGQQPGDRRRRPLRGVPQDPRGRAARRRLHPLADRQPRRPPRHLDADLRRLAEAQEAVRPLLLRGLERRGHRPVRADPLRGHHRDRAAQAPGLLRARQPDARQVLRTCRSRSPGCAGSRAAIGRPKPTSATSRAPTSRCRSSRDHRTVGMPPAAMPRAAVRFAPLPSPRSDAIDCAAHASSQ